MYKEVAGLMAANACMMHAYISEDLHAYAAVTTKGGEVMNHHAPAPWSISMSVSLIFL